MAGGLDFPQAPGKAFSIHRHHQQGAGRCKPGVSDVSKLPPQSSELLRRPIGAPQQSSTTVCTKVSGFRKSAAESTVVLLVAFQKASGGASESTPHKSMSPTSAMTRHSSVVLEAPAVIWRRPPDGLEDGEDESQVPVTSPMAKGKGSRRA